MQYNSVCSLRDDTDVRLGWQRLTRDTDLMWFDVLRSTADERLWHVGTGRGTGAPISGALAGGVGIRLQLILDM